MSQMRYEIQVSAFQVLDGAQVSVVVREHPSDVSLKIERPLRFHFTATDLDVSKPDSWARDVLVEVLEHL